MNVCCNPALLEQPLPLNGLSALRLGGRSLLPIVQGGLRDGTPGWGQFCIDKQLAAALHGDVSKGLFFRGIGALPFGTAIGTVGQMLQRLLTRGIPLGTPPDVPVRDLAALTAAA